MDVILLIKETYSKEMKALSTVAQVVDGDGAAGAVLMRWCSGFDFRSYNGFIKF
jgi:hypothetical protein